MKLRRRAALAVAVTAVLLPHGVDAAPAPTISTVAGALGTGPGAAVELNIVSLAIRGTTLYAADPWWSVVRKIDARTGRVSLAAGNGSLATFGDGGSALAAGIERPGAVAVAADGTLYIGQEDGLVRRVGGDGRISTVVGGGTQDDGVLPLPARDVRLGTISGLSFTADGDLLIADGARVRRVSGGLVTTVAGTGEPGYSGDGGPARLATLRGGGEVVEGRDGSIYVADSLNNRVRRITPTGLISTYAGDGTRGTNTKTVSRGDGGPATAARITYPDALAWDATGALLVGGAGSVRRVDGAGVIGTYVRGVDGEALAVGADRSTYVGDLRLTRRDAGGRTTVLAGGGRDREGTRAVATQIRDARVVAVGPGGLLVGDGTGGRIRGIDGRGIIRTKVDFGVERGMLPFDGNNLYATIASLDDLAVDRDGTLYVLDEFFGVLFRRPAKGKLRTIVGANTVDSCFGRRGGDGGPASKAGLCMPEDVDVRDGRVLIADTFTDRVRLVDTRGRITTVAGRYAGSSAGPGPDFGGGFSGDGGPATAARLSRPTAVAWLPGGGFVIADAGNDRIRQVDTKGRIKTIASVESPVDVTVSTGGTIYALDEVGRVLRIGGGRGTVVAGNGLPGFSGDGGDARRARIGPATEIAVSRDGRTIYIADPRNHRIRAVRLP